MRVSVDGQGRRVKRIESGELQPLKPLPSELRLQQEYGVARGTVRAAIALLRERGLVMTMPQRGTYVTERRREA
ncbi:GntR family transcriptional regulator [Micromonospora sp. WMMD987]|uniref:GntR family transcriptional regulator n=1 Tax=Micromonospora sp. WMMD987 TaxID=3016089 RepID=UPI00249B461C|nr:GntR family transcriptional regulator [Micromonospora sp. WMMD987]WFE98367.1 GntR family transcriptional regulator [Micromonospora sp. WMMD987]